jgi:hypothetical protein
MVQYLAPLRYVVRLHRQGRSSCRMGVPVSASCVRVAALAVAVVARDESGAGKNEKGTAQSIENRLSLLSVNQCIVLGMQCLRNGA